VDDALMPSLLALTDVMGTGHHAARAAKVGPGKTAAVVGDGAVGLCGVIACRRLGAEQIILLGRNPARVALAKEFGATDVVSERGDAAIERVANSPTTWERTPSSSASDSRRRCSPRSR
jgi:threonine dehydrogenase-like Zn-dependent dehydrogenase